MIKEFREFIQRGNALDLAVAVILAGAFGLIVKALVDEMLNPLIGLMFQADLGNLMVVVSGNSYETVAAARAAGEIVFGYGLVLNAVIQFVLIAFVLFLILKGYNARLRTQETEEPKAPTAPPREQVLLEEIRDLLRDRG